MKATTMLDTIRSLLGVPACAIPLSVCRPARTYLLDRAGIPYTGTAVLFAIPYVMTEDIRNPERNLSLYAVPRDYHGYMKELDTAVLPSLRKAYPQHTFALFADHSPILEADAAARAGLGVLGINGLLITKEYGSFVFIGEIIIDADYSTVTGESLPSFPAEPPTCEKCGACLAACPMGCREGDRANCLSALTQKKGTLTETEINAVRKGGLAWGCDACQLACPHNIHVIREGQDTTIPYFLEKRLTRIRIDTLAAMSDHKFASRAYSWRGRGVIARNLDLLEEDHTRSEDQNDNETPERSRTP